MAKEQPIAIAGFFGPVDYSLAIHIFCGLLAFALYQLVKFFTLSTLGLARNPSLFPFELLIFSLLAVCLSLYSTISRLRSQPTAVGNRQSEDARKLHSAQLASISKRLTTFCLGIDHSLSAIMFFARAQLGLSPSPHLERDLREVMERIDQIQLLVSEMQRSLENLGPPDSADTVGADLHRNTESLAVPTPESVGEYNGAGGLYCLRKTARKTVIRPIKVSYSTEETNLQFDTYTVNVCEEGACIVFSGNDLGIQSEIGIQMPEEFEAKARIRWIQPAKEKAFRLAGIEFLDHRVKVASM